MKSSFQTAQKKEVVTPKEVNMRILLNLLGLFIFSGITFTYLTTPPSTTDCTREFFYFLVGSVIIYYLLVNIYHIGNKGRKVVLTTLFLLGVFIIFMAYYSMNNPVSHCY
ncbi:hypothetical protein [Sutcliffiella horikoshii]|uniref:hypothetical protein n=1 Tax=Sutcliffiella horikoshii TaxID=79883 RepID=UPI001F3656A8|nr:hypothetical protein [Sutcliffiella horikoshii]MCG1023440.1 hypothetical protein [Sutcliffiella horikoshii]